MLFPVTQRQFPPPVAKPFHAGDAVSVIARSESTIRMGRGHRWSPVTAIHEGDAVTFYPHTVRPDQYNRVDVWMYCEANGSSGWFLRSMFEYKEFPLPIVMPSDSQPR